MLNALVSYQFDEEPVRVVMILGEPWFVANDVSRVLGYRASSDMVRNLADDEKGTHIVRTPGGDQDMNVISESGLYAAILKSRREEAQRFRKWVTGEVLPAIRKTGAYELDGHDAPPPLELAVDLDAPSVTAALNLVREARRLFGTEHGRRVWIRLGLPEPIVDASPSVASDPVTALVKAYVADKDKVTRAEVTQAVGLDPDNLKDLHRVTASLHFCGRMSINRYHNGRQAKVWMRRSRVEG